MHLLLKASYWAAAGLLLAGCQPAAKGPPEQKKQPAQQSLPAAAPAATQAPGSLAAPLLGSYRYRGTVGGQAVTVELTIFQPALAQAHAAHAQDSIECVGSYTYDQHPMGLLRLNGLKPWRPGQPLLLTETDAARPRQPTGYWQATQPSGPVLMGSWRSPAGQVLPFSLHEDYTDGQGHLVAVKYEVLQESEEAPCQPERKKGESKAAYRARTEDLTSTCSQEFLHLLGPDTLCPILRALQCPVPAKRQQQLRDEVAGCNQVERQLSVVYNAHGLLSLESVVNEFYEGTDHPAHAWTTTTYDLRTGQPLALATLIRPGTDSILNRLIAQRLEKDNNTDMEELLNRSEADSSFGTLAQPGLSISGEGVEFTYSNYYDSLTPPVTVAVAWAAAAARIASGPHAARARFVARR